MSYHVKQNLFPILPTEAKLGYPQLGMKQTVCSQSLGYEVPERVPELLNDTWLRVLVMRNQHCSKPLACSLHRYGKNTKTYCSGPSEEGQLHSSAQASRHSTNPNYTYSVRYGDT